MIEIKNLEKSYKDKKILKGINMSIKKGSFTALVGSNGAGKSTLVDIICKSKKANSGSIDYSFNEKNIFDEIGVQIQDARFDSRMKIKEIIDLWKEIYKKREIADIESLIDLMELRHILDNKSDKISGGQRQKLNILLTLFHNPQLLIFDELTTGLDASSRDNIHEYLKLINENGKTIFMVSHYMDEVEALCDMVYFLKDGVIAYEGSPQFIKEKYNCNSLQDFVKTHLNDKNKGGLKL